MKDNRAWKAGDIPFKVDRNAPGSLTKQMANGLREAIASGRFKAGETLPTFLEWTRLLGVSARVPEAALAILAREGMVSVHKRTGCVVNPRRQKAWNGRVLAVVPGGDHNFYHNILVGRIRDRIGEAGYLFSQVAVPRAADGRYDFRRLGHELKARPDFTLLVENQSEIERLLSKSGLPFGVFGEKPCTLAGCVANFACRRNAAVPRLVAHCVKAGVRRVIQVSRVAQTPSDAPEHFDAAPALRETGIAVEEFDTPLAPDFGRIESVTRGALLAFRDRFAREGRGWLPDLLVFTDDFVATGALVAMLAEGIAIPRDIRVVSLSNRGLGPVFPVSLTRIENDPVKHGEQLAEAVCAFLAGRRIRKGMGVIAPEYIVGESFPRGPASPL